MINQKRVGHMTRMAVFEKYEEKDIEIAVHYKKEDYIRQVVLMRTVVGIIYFLTMYVLVAALFFATYLDRVDSTVIMVSIAGGLIWLAVRTFFHVQHVREYAADRYDECRAKLERFERDLDELNTMYDDELAQTTSWSGELI